MRRLDVLLFPAVLLLAALTARADTQYALKLERPYQVGDKTKVAAVGAIKETVIREVTGVEPSRSDETIGIRLDGVSEVKAVDEQGRRTHVRFVVSVCTVMVGDKSKRLLAPGKSIDIKWEKDECKYFVDGEDWTEDVGRLFDLAVELSDPAGMSDDKIFRTDSEKRSVKDTWAIDAASAVKEFDRIGLKTKEESIWGETTLSSTEKTDEIPTVTLRLRLKASNLNGPGRKPDQKITIRNAAIESDSTVVLPVDPAGQALREESKSTVTSEVKGAAIHFTRTTERVYERVMTPVK